MSLDSLSPHINLEQSRKQAKDLLKAFRAGERGALEVVRSHHPRFRERDEAQAAQRQFRLADAQLVVARLHYFESWPKLLQHIEDYRQITPPNAVDVARLLLDSGAEVDATSEAYGGGWTSLGLVATSTPPRRAGVQIPLIDLLLERGAAH